MKIKLSQLRQIIREEISADINYSKIIYKGPFIEYDGTLYWTEAGQPTASNESITRFLSKNSLENPQHFPYEGEDELGVHLWSVSKDGRTAGYIEAYEGNDKQNENKLQPLRTAQRNLEDLLAKKYFSADEAPPEAEDDDVFGKYAFAGNGRRQDAPEEPDTPAEDALFHGITNVVDGGGGTGFSPDAISTYKAALAGGKYKKALRDVTATKSIDTVTRVYRGTIMSEQRLRSILGLDPTDPLPPEGSTDATYNYHPPRSSAISSWSWSKRVASAFATPSADDVANNRPYGVIMSASTTPDGPNTFVHITKLMYALIKPEYMNEKESIGVGDITVDRIEWAVSKIGQ